MNSGELKNTSAETKSLDITEESAKLAHCLTSLDGQLGDLCAHGCLFIVLCLQFLVFPERLVITKLPAVLDNTIH